MKLLLVVVLVVKAFAHEPGDFSHFDEAKQFINEVDIYSYSDEAGNLSSEKLNHNSVDKTQQFLNEEDTNSYSDEAGNLSSEQLNQNSVDEILQIKDKLLGAAEESQNPDNSKIDEMLELRGGNTRWCRSRGGRCRSQKSSCGRGNQNSPRGKPYCKNRKTKCCYPLPPVTTTTSVPITTVASTIIVDSTTTISGCGGQHTSSSGTIRHPLMSGTYQDNENCVWIIRAAGPFKITFMSFDTESRYAILYVRDGGSISGTDLGNLTGSSIPSPVYITTNTAFLLFTSDGSQTRTGFEINWEPTVTSTTRIPSTTAIPGCGGQYTSSSGTIRHPLKSGTYQDNENCVWIIRASGPFRITFTSFDTESRYDILYVRDGGSLSGTDLGNLTGSSIPSPVYINTNTAYFLFTSDGSQTRTGFEIKWEPTGTTCQCGVANTERLIGGTEVNPKRKYPWQIGLVNPGYWIGCGGTIINDRWILTAAHCITNRTTCELIYNRSSQLKVWVGEHHQFDGNDDVSETKKYRIKSYIPHPDYNCGSLNYDFALLELTEAIPFNSVIRPICLPEDDTKTYTGQTGKVTGWGSINNNGQLSTFLREVQLPIRANDNCGRWSSRNPLAAMKLCAGGQRGKDSCGGDSGGPMYVVENSKYVQVGVVSYGSIYGCANIDYPGVYARVSKVLPWITQTTRNGRKCD